jgi:EAL domain-containing protein (putative c-di-GMP-specific phosphodiesterase class I)/GGDEF domain-containing protein
VRKLFLLVTLTGLVSLILTGTYFSASGGSARLQMPPISYLQAPIPGTDAASLLTSGTWQPLPDRIPNFGYVNSSFWYRMPVPEGAERQVMEVSYPQLDHLRFVLLRNGEPVTTIVTGDRLPFSQRPFAHPKFLFPYSLEKPGDYQILLGVATHGSHQVPISFWQEDQLINALIAEDRWHSLYFGILITTVLLNLIIYVALQEVTYLHYVLTASSYAFLIATLYGASFQLLWPSHPGIQNQGMLVSVPLTLFFALQFCRSFLKLADKAPAWDLVSRLGMVLSTLALIASFFLDYNTSIRLSVAIAMGGAVFMAFAGPVQWWRGSSQAGYYTVAWSLLLIGTALTAANKYGFLPVNWLTRYGLELGSALEAILLTFALASRLYHERQEKLHSRESELAALAARRQAEVRLMDQALHHGLTGLPNRSSFEIVLQELINEQPHRRYAVAVIHLNNLRNITRTLGHRNTDRLLELAARRFNSIIGELPGIFSLETSAKGAFYLASLENDSFGFVIDADIILQSPRFMLGRLEEIREPLDYLGMQLSLEPQIGTATYPDHARDTNTLIRRAYIAQESREARERGLALYRPSRDAYSADRLTLVSDLRQALQESRLELYLQPKLRLSDRRVTGLEALIRWPGRSQPIGTDELIALAEQTGLIKPLTRRVMEQSLALRTLLLERGHDLDISVNISPNNLREPDFLVFVKRLMASYHSHQGRITLEVTETSMMQDPENSLKTLTSLKQAGIPLSIDDFGSGYSSLSYIKQLPASEIKIDRSLVKDLVEQADDRVIVRTTINMCHSLGYKVVAEGVENEETLNLLADMGCDEVQGYYLTPPLPLGGMIEWLDKELAGKQQQSG